MSGIQMEISLSILLQVLRFPNITGTNKTPTEVQNLLLDKLGVATVAGPSFGEYGEGFLRLSCASSDESIEEATMRIKSIF